MAGPTENSGDTAAGSDPERRVLTRRAHLADLQAPFASRAALLGPAFLRTDVIAQFREQAIDVLYLFCHAQGLLRVADRDRAGQNPGTDRPERNLLSLPVGALSRISVHQSFAPPDRGGRDLAQGVRGGGTVAAAASRS